MGGWEGGRCSAQPSAMPPQLRAQQALNRRRPARGGACPGAQRGRAHRRVYRWRRYASITPSTSCMLRRAAGGRGGAGRRRGWGRANGGVRLFVLRQASAALRARRGPAAPAPRQRTRAPLLLRGRRGAAQEAGQRAGLLRSGAVGFRRGEVASGSHRRGVHSDSAATGQQAQGGRQCVLAPRTCAARSTASGCTALPGPLARHLPWPAAATRQRCSAAAGPSPRAAPAAPPPPRPRTRARRWGWAPTRRRRLPAHGRCLGGAGRLGHAGGAGLSVSR